MGGPARDVRRIVLVGFMSAGKTTIGPLLADSLGWRFVDVDEEIVRRTGMSVADIFRQRGEAVFRRLEARLTARLCSVEDTVIAPGGGWVMAPMALERLPQGTWTVWLRVSAEEAVRRALGSGVERPLLAGEDPLGTARTLLAARQSRYRQVDQIVAVDEKTPAEITAAILNSFAH
jgi:shikimate kinase